MQGQEGTRVGGCKGERTHGQEGTRAGGCKGGRAQGQEGGRAPFHLFTLAPNEPPRETFTAWYFSVFILSIEHFKTHKQGCHI